MTNALPILFAAVVGFGHAFELDHLLAVGNMVTRRKTIREAIRDGVYWGLGHTSTILIIGAIILLARVGIAERTFQYFEAGVGAMLVALGLHRIWKRKSAQQSDLHDHPHPHADRHLAYGVGLTHG
ncbi:MAG: urease accessory protein, partial [Haliscomenobacter sp.]